MLPSSCRRPPLHLPLLLLAAVLLTTTPHPRSFAAASASAVPASWALLPVSSLAASYQQQYNCDIHTSPAPPPCNAHGTCLLLLDLAANDSLAILNSSTIASEPLSQWPLDQPDLADLSPPLTLCSCDADWTGRSMFLNRHATDHNTCVISLNAITGLNIFALVVSVWGGLLGCARLLEWGQAVRAKLAKHRRNQTQHHPTFAESAQSPTTRTTLAVQQAQHPSALRQQQQQQVGSPTSASSHDTTSHNGGTATSQSSSNSSSSTFTLARSTVAFWLRSLHDAAFYVPAAIVCFFLSCLAAFPQLLADRRTVLGQAPSVDFFEVLASSMFAVIVCVSVHGILRLSGKVSKMDARDQAMMRSINERLRVACVVSAVVSIAVIQLTFVMSVHPELIDPLITTVMLARSAPYWVLAGVYIKYTGEVCRTLLHGIDTLSEQQQLDRKDVMGKLQLSRYVFASVAYFHCVTVLILAFWPIAHSYIPYGFYLEWGSCAAISIARLNLLRPSSKKKAKPNQVAAAPAVSVLLPMQRSPSAPATTRLKSSGSNDRKPHLTVPGRPSGNGSSSNSASGEPNAVSARPAVSPLSPLVAVVVEEEAGQGSDRRGDGQLAVLIAPSLRSSSAALGGDDGASDGFTAAAGAFASTSEMPGSVVV